MSTTKQRQRHMTPMEYAKAYLSSRLEDLIQRTASINLSRMHANEWPSTDQRDRIEERQNQEVLMRLAATTRFELEQTRHALSRVEAGTYGFCERCGHMIHADRLRAVPEATVCAACAQDKSMAGEIPISTPRGTSPHAQRTANALPLRS